MQTTQNMGLTVWDNPDDPYDHNQLADNWQTVDDHDHTPGRGKPLTAGSFADGAVGTDQLAPNSVTSIHIKDGEVKTVDIANGAVTAAKIDAALWNAVLPLGSVISWFRPNANVAVPTGFVVCAGGTLAEGEHDWIDAGAINIPDLSNRFIMGVAAGSAERVSGGSNDRSWNHSHTVASHQHNVPSHTHVNPPHNHGISMGGEHGHVTGPAWRGNVNVEGNAPTVHDYPEPFAFQDHGHNLTIDGGHNHGGATSMAGGTTSSGSGSLTTSASGELATSAANLGGDVRPAYYGLLYIIKVRNRTG